MLNNKTLNVSNSNQLDIQINKHKNKKYSFHMLKNNKFLLSVISITKSQVRFIIPIYI